MAIELLFNVLQVLTGSQFVADKAQRNEYVIRLLKQVGLDPEHPPADFEGVYAYALVNYGVGKPKACLELFRSQDVRQALLL
jgi:predicted NACHT family NTPase